MTPKKEAKEIYDEIDNISFTVRVKTENESADYDIELPDWVIKEIACRMIDRMAHKPNTITEAYWKETRAALNNL